MSLQSSSTSRKMRLPEQAPSLKSTIYTATTIASIYILRFSPTVASDPTSPLPAPEYPPSPYFAITSPEISILSTLLHTSPSQHPQSASLYQRILLLVFALILSALTFSALIMVSIDDHIHEDQLATSHSLVRIRAIGGPRTKDDRKFSEELKASVGTNVFESPKYDHRGCWRGL